MNVKDILIEQMIWTCVQLNRVVSVLDKQAWEKLSFGSLMQEVILLQETVKLQIFAENLTAQREFIARQKLMEKSEENLQDKHRK